MGTLTRNWLMAATLGLLVACGGGGGGDRAAGVEPGPPPGGGPVEPPPPIIPEPVPPAPYAEAEVLLANITSVSIDGSGIATVEFQLTDGAGTAITDLEGGNVRFTIAKLQSSPVGNLTGSWQSYVNRIEPPDAWDVTDVGTEDRLQASYEREEENFVNNGDGTYSYTFAQSVTVIPDDILAQAETEGLDLSYEPDRTHRVAMQFDGNPNTTANPFYDWVPSSGATSGILTMDIAATANCNNCHDPLGIHGGNRREVQYCVTCHNGGSTDAHTTNTVDMKVMIHKIHAGENLPSVKAGGKYNIIGYRGSDHDYSGLIYPQDIRNCVNCHAGTATGAGRDDLVLTSQGDNWAEYPYEAACISCHDGVSDDGFDAPAHAARYEDTECAGCHSLGGRAGSIADSHRMLIEEAREEFAAEIISVDSTMRGEQAVVTFKIVNPKTGEAYDLKNDPAFNNPPVSRLAIDVAWDTDDYNNTGNEGDNASAVEVTDIASLVDNGDGSFSATMPVAIPDGSKAPGVPASGSGAAVIEGHPMKELDLEGNGELVASRIPLTNVHEFFSIDEADGEPDKRRVSVDIDNCNSCHATLSLHGNNRTDNIDSCVVCHNPRNTDKRVREVAQDPPTDGKDEESLDFKTMVHAIHAAGIRENALEIVGFRGFSTHRYDEEHVHYPGNLANCTACHTSDGYLLPLEDGVLGTTIDTGEDRADPADDIVITPIAATCSGCHDDAVAKSHMESTGGASFSTTQQAIDDGEVVESCAVCHGEGHAFDVGQVHRPSDE